MKFLLDTSVVIAHMRGTKSLDMKYIAAGAGISIITLGELLYGAYRSINTSKALETVSGFIKDLDIRVVPLHELVMNEFAIMKVHLEKKGKWLEDFDIFIAATALVNNLTLVTYNKRHFERIEGLKIY